MFSRNMAAFFLGSLNGRMPLQRANVAFAGGSSTLSRNHCGFIIRQRFKVSQVEYFAICFIQFCGSLKCGSCELETTVTSYSDHARLRAVSDWRH